MPNPKQRVARQWDKPSKQKALQLYCQRYSLPEIERQTNIPVGTLSRWIYMGDEIDWRGARDAVTLSLSDVVTAMQCRIVSQLDSTLRIVEKFNARVEKALDNNEPIDAKSLETLSRTFAKNADVFLRMLSR